ncbi:MAG TPA: alpha/beta fold hydrolase [Micromonosporaceae bacterium]|jgi:dienelactone hydrolase|nr:alpha/beta fold hydrolase [Micromonosporaceae bacterium]
MAVRRLVGVAAFLFLLAGCAGKPADRSGAAPPASPASSAPATSAAPPQAGVRCPADVTGLEQVRFGPGGASNLGGVILGTGRTGVVLAHQTNGDLCMWLEYGTTLAKAGYRVLAMDMPGYGSSYDAQAVPIDDAVAAGATLLRGTGATKVVLIGASMGGTAVLGAGTKAQPPVAGVISLSAPSVFGQVNAAEVVKQLAVPVLYAACASDGSFTDDAKQLYAATPAKTARQLVIDACFSHGVDTLRDSTKIKSAVQAFLAKYAPA